ncbi:MAG: anti-sigma factor [Flammeovirgaceae bacterium]|nr:anti-sigma factor [Flammeovirgaceae bacterium]
MNIEEYISSGVLEAYVLGDLPTHEMKEVEANLQRYPALREELRRIEEFQESFAMRNAIQPRGEVKAKLMEKLESRPQAKSVSMKTDTSVSLWKYAAAAAVVIAVVSSYFAYDYRSKWQDAQTSLNDLIAQNQQIAQDYNRVNLRLDKIESDLKVVGDPAFTRVVMKGTPNATDALAFVYWNASTQETYLSVQNMRALSHENQYQLWAIVDGKPVDMGVFDTGIAGLLRMKPIGSGAAAFAVTIEPRGGNTTPTLGTMQVTGSIIKG